MKGRPCSHLMPVIAAMLLSACTLEPRFEQPEAPVPDSWPAGDAYLKQSEAALPSVSYTDVFKDSRLQALIQAALVNNRDLMVAAATVAATREQYHIQRGALFPEIDLGASAAHRNTSAASSQNSSTSSSGDTYAVDLGITAFELDLFGRVRSLSHAALDRYLATEVGARATRLSLVSQIAVAWLAYGADQSLIAILQETVASGQRSVDLTRGRLQGGIAPRTDLRQAEIILNQAMVDLAASRTALAQDLNLLELLVGEPVEASLLPASIEEAAATLGELPAGADSSILLRRPDVVQAEYQLRAANAEIGAARAALFPRISLGALVGYSSKTVDSLFTSAAETSSRSAALALPLFTGGAVLAGRKEVRYQYEAAVATYEKSIQTAFREVADALARRGTIAEQEQFTRALVDSALDNYTLSDARYRGGIDTFLQSLDAQRSLYSAQRGLVSTQLSRATNLVTLYQVLGGDALLEAPANR